MKTDCHTHFQYASGIPYVLALTKPELPDNYTGLFSIGVHPMYAADTEIPESFSALFSRENCAAIGECGLDRRASMPLKNQEFLFRKHIEAAETLGKPLVIHAVRARQELIHVKKSYPDSRIPWILHGCRGNERAVMELIEAGFTLSFGDGLLRDAGILEPFFRNIPLDRILMETDERQGSLDAIYAAAASLRSMNVEDFADAVFANFQRCLNRRYCKKSGRGILNRSRK